VFFNLKCFPITETRFGHYLAELTKMLAMDLNLVMIFIPNNKGDLFSMVKKNCTVEAGIPSQVVTATVLNKPKGLMSVATKVAIQMQAKIGGEPWHFKIPIINSMVVS
jgi:aubergine-like protein